MSVIGKYFSKASIRSSDSKLFTSSAVKTIFYIEVTREKGRSSFFPGHFVLLESYLDTVNHFRASSLNSTLKFSLEFVNWMRKQKVMLLRSRAV